MFVYMLIEAYSGPFNHGAFDQLVTLVDQEARLDSLGTRNKKGSTHSRSRRLEGVTAEILAELSPR